MKKTKESPLIIYADSHPGISGKQNEDRYKVSYFQTGEDGQTQSALVVLCDGIGGHRAGEVAAEMAVSTITEVITASDAENPLRLMREAITRASDAIYRVSGSEQGRNGMGTTCACTWVIGDRLYTANVGDSRIYLLRDDHLVQLSTDHTWIQEALDAGVLEIGNHNNHPNAHVIRRYLGSKVAPEPDFRLWFFENEQSEEAVANQGLVLQPGDVILLCSDGLTDLVGDDEIRSVIQNTASSDIPDTLISMANQRGGHDNTTVVLISVPPKFQKGKKVLRKRRRVWGCLAVIASVSVLVAAVLFGWRWRQGQTPQEETQQPGLEQTLPVEATLIRYSETSRPDATLIETAATPMEHVPSSATRTPWPTHTQTE